VFQTGVCGGRGGRFETLLGQLESGILGRTAVVLARGLERQHHRRSNLPGSVDGTLGGDTHWWLAFDGRLGGGVE